MEEAPLALHARRYLLRKRVPHRHAREGGRYVCVITVSRLGGDALHGQAAPPGADAAGPDAARRGRGRHGARDAHPVGPGDDQ